MILIARREADYLRENKMGKYVHVSSQTHKSKSKRYYLTENPRALKKLYKYREDIIVKED